MKTKHTFALSTLVRKSKANKQGEIPIILRITIEGRITEIATKHYIQPDLWDATTGYVKGKSTQARTVNETIDLLKTKAKQQYNKLLEAGKDIDLDVLKDAILGVEKKQPMLIEFFKKKVREIEIKIDIEYSRSYYNSYRASLKHLVSFVKEHYGKDDIRLKELNYEFIAEYELYLKTKGSCHQNGAIKHIYKLKNAIKLAMKYEYLDRNPFLQHSMVKDKVIIQPLSEDELQRIIAKEFYSERLSIVKDMFVFTCYTGLAYIDAKRLTKAHIGLGVDGQEWIFTERKKTDNPCGIPLLPPARAILDKYQDHPKVKKTGHLLPIPSNQKFNEYLKEIGEICGIRKHLHVHIGRHTFATTVALQNGVPLVAVQGMLGHDKIETTQIYAKVDNKLVADAMQSLRLKLMRS